MKVLSVFGPTFSQYGENLGIIPVMLRAKLFVPEIWPFDQKNWTPLAYTDRPTLFPFTFF